MEGIALRARQPPARRGRHVRSVALVDTDRGTVVKRLHGHATRPVRRQGTGEPDLDARRERRRPPARHREQGGHHRGAAVVAARAAARRARRCASDRGNAESQLSPDGRWLQGRARQPRTSCRTGWRPGTCGTRRRVPRVRPPRGRRSRASAPTASWSRSATAPGSVQVYSTATWKPVTRVLAGEAGRASAWRSDRTAGRWRPGARRRGAAVGRRSGAGARRAAARRADESGSIPPSRPTARHLVATYANGRAYVWDIRPASLIRQACRVAGRQPDPRRVGRVPARARLRARLLTRYSSAASSDVCVGTA